MKLILKCKNDLSKLISVKSAKERNRLINKVNICVIKAIAEIAHNCLLGNVPLSNCNYKKLKKYKSLIRKIANRKISLSKKRKIIKIQKGGIIWNILIPAALSLLSSVIEKKFIK